MERKQQLLIIEPPSELQFVGPFNKPSVTTIKLTNPTDQTLLFKIKTTAPRKYCVRPNFGAVKPNEHVVVDIGLQPFTLEASEKNKHKFMVQSFALPEGSPETDIEILWREVDPENLADTKLKCVFSFPGGKETGFPTEKKAVAAENASKGEVKTPPLMPSKEETISTSPKDYEPETDAVESVKLKEQVGNLKRENIILKEELIRLKMKGNSNVAFTPPAAVQQVPMFYIILSILAAIFGVLIGKYIW